MNASRVVLLAESCIESLQDKVAALDNGDLLEAADAADCAELFALMAFGEVCA
jgi:hypothetical protein